MRKFIAVILCSAGVVLAEDKNATQPQTPDDLKIEIEKILKETNTPGAAVAIVSRDRNEWVAGIGKADVAKNKPVTTGTLFRIGSVSKNFAALAALKLQEEGKLKLTNTVKQWAPEVAFENPWESTDPVRLIHLMEHTAGFDDLYFKEWAHDDPTPIALKDALAFGVSSRISRWRPGSKMAYCNSGPAVLAYVIEKVAGQKFEDYVRENFFAPLHMDSASYTLTPDVDAELTTLYRNDGITPIPYWHIVYRPAGSISASAESMANYVRFLLNRGTTTDGTRLLQAESLDSLEKPQTLPAAQLGDFAGYGLYNYVSFEKGYEFHGHSGGIPGALADMAYSTQLGRGYAIMINCAHDSAKWRIESLVRRYLVRDLPKATLPAAKPVSAELKERFGGFYQFVSFNQQGVTFGERLKTRRVEFDEQGMLFGALDGSAPTRWVATDKNLFRKADESRATLALIVGENGEALLQNEDGTYQRVSKSSVIAGFALMTMVYALTFSSIGFVLIWGPRKMLGRLRNPGPLAVRTLPLLGSLALYTWFGLFAAAARNPDMLPVLGTPNTYSITVFVLGLALTILAVASVLIVARARKEPMNRVAYWHSAGVALSLAVAVAYLAGNGMIGLCTWR